MFDIYSMLDIELSSIFYKACTGSKKHLFQLTQIKIVYLGCEFYHNPITLENGLEGLLNTIM